MSSLYSMQAYVPEADGCVVGAEGIPSATTPSWSICSPAGKGRRGGVTAAECVRRF